MPLQPGTKLGQYGILAKIGAGGMGEVYRARDTKLGREVAIKVLPEEFSQDKDRVARFEREARLLASLNHPHIATLHGFEESNGQKFLVMELVEGETLAERIAAGPIPMAEILPLFTQIAEGLVAAHERGVIHRDLKPANIKIAEDGNPKILDFGLAKAFVGEGEAADDSSESPTLTKGTALGVIMGTASYMSPEQARGKRVDKRTDIWAFGCCLYETLTGKKAFAGETVTDTISAVVRAEPDWRKLPAMLPSNVRHVMQLCLRKARATRLRDIGDVLLLLDGSPPMSTESKTSERQSRLPIWTVLLAILGGALVAGWGAWHLKPTAPTRMSRFKISLPPGSLHYGTGNLALSYDGTLLVYVARGEKQRQVFIRRMDRVDAVPLEGAVDAHEVLLSPDASTVAFFTAETGLTIKKINLDNLSATEVGEGNRLRFRRCVGTRRHDLFRDERNGASVVAPRQQHRRTRCARRVEWPSNPAERPAGLRLDAASTWWVRPGTTSEDRGFFSEHPGDEDSCRWRYESPLRREWPSRFPTRWIVACRAVRPGASRNVW